MKKIQIKDKMYHRWLWFITDCNLDEFESWIAKKYGVEKEIKSKNIAQLSTLIKEDRTRHYYIWIENFDWYIWQQEAIAHEVLHFTFKVLKHLGIEYCENSEEAYTYYFESIMIEILDKLKDRNPHIKKHKKKNEKTKKKKSTSKKQRRKTIS